jgi:hypothetical protein
MGCAKKWLSDMKLSRVHPVSARVLEGILEPSCKIRELVTTQSQLVQVRTPSQPETVPTQEMLVRAITQSQQAQVQTASLLARATTSSMQVMAMM